MTTQKPKYTKVRNIFLIVFLLSSLLAACLLIVSPVTFAGSDIPSQPEPAPSQIATIGSVVAILGSCTTSIVTFFGFVVTTIVAWRKESGDRTDRELERKLKEVELDKAKFELNQLKSNQSKQTPPEEDDPR